MNTPLDPLEALAGIPCIDEQSVMISRLHGGLSNRVFLVRAPEQNFVLRVPAAAEVGVAPARHAEADVQRAAATNGLAPRVLHADPMTGVLLCEFIEGFAWRPTDLEEPGNIERLAMLLRQVHELPLCGQRLDLAAIAREYESALATELTEIAAQCVSIVDAGTTADTELACCHNDIVAANVMDDGDLRLIDWEYAGDNDPLFDLASAIAYHDLDPALSARLLDTWADGHDAALAERLEVQARVFDATQWLWLAARHSVRPSGQSGDRLAQIAERLPAQR